MNEGSVTTDLFAFLTTSPNAEVAPVHPKAMPVILRDRDEIETWMTAPWSEAKAMQRPLPDGSLKIVPEPVITDGPTKLEAPSQASAEEAPLAPTQGSLF